MTIYVPSLEETVENLVQVVRDLAQSAPKEELRQRADALLVLDHQRRLARDGKHPIAGETKEQYEAHMADATRGGRGYHPVTRETIEQYEEEGHKVFSSSKVPDQKVPDQKVPDLKQPAKGA